MFVIHGFSQTIPALSVLNVLKVRLRELLRPLFLAERSGSQVPADGLSHIRPCR